VRLASLTTDLRHLLLLPERMHLQPQSDASGCAGTSCGVHIS
jgi:hypothetical protein